MSTKRSNNIAGKPAAAAPSQELFRSLLRTLGQLRQAMEPHFAPFGISGPQWGALRALQRASEEGYKALRLSELAGRLLIRPPSVTAVVDRLERRGLVKRGLSQSDMRVRTVSLTDDGRELIEKVQVGHPQRVAMIFSGLSPAEQQAMLQGLKKLQDHLDHVVEGQAIAGPKGPSGAWMKEC